MMAEIPPGNEKPIVEQSADARQEQTTPAVKKISHLDLYTSVIADAAGNAVVQLGQVPANADWFLERASVQTDSIAVSQATIYRDIPDALHRKDFTPAGNDDVADNVQPLWFASGSIVLVQWTGCTPGANCVVAAQLRVES
jgi:hypothetical protein